MHAKVGGNAVAAEPGFVVAPKRSRKVAVRDETPSPVGNRHAAIDLAHEVLDLEEIPTMPGQEVDVVVEALEEENAMGVDECGVAVARSGVDGHAFVSGDVTESLRSRHR